ALLMQRLYFIYFWQGRSPEMLALTTSLLPALPADGYLLGYHAFALEENRFYAEALPLAERALALNPKDAWAVHAVAHVLYERGEKHLGAAARGWLEMPLLLFHDLHVGMALSAAGDWGAAETQLERLRERGKKSRHRTLPEVVVPMMEGIHAFARGEYADAAARLAP